MYIEGINATIRFDLSNVWKGSKFFCEIRAEKQFDENNCKCGWKKVVSLNAFCKMQYSHILIDY